MREPGSPEPWEEDEDLTNLEAAERLSREYNNHMRRQAGDRARKRPIEEVTADFKDVLGWLLIEDPENINDQQILASDELYFHYSKYDIEDTFFVVYEELGRKREVRFGDIVAEHKETNISDWQMQQTKKAADFLIAHGADENEINEWKAEEGSGRQQRALRRMHWLLSQPYMQQFTEFLNGRTLEELQPIAFKDLIIAIRRILNEGYDNQMSNLKERDNLIPRKQEEFDETLLWLKRAMNICTNVFEKDIDEKVYITRPRKNGAVQ